MATNMIWLYASLSVLIVCLLSLIGITLFSLLPKRYYRYTLLFLISLGVGAMAGDAFLHIIPEVLGIHDHSSHSDHHHVEKRHTHFAANTSVLLNNQSETLHSRNIDKHDAHTSHVEHVLHEPHSQVHFDDFTWKLLSIVLTIYLSYLLELLINKLSSSFLTSDAAATPCSHSHLIQPKLKRKSEHKHAHHHDSGHANSTDSDKISLTCHSVKPSSMNSPHHLHDAMHCSHEIFNDDFSKNAVTLKAISYHQQMHATSTACCLDPSDSQICVQGLQNTFSYTAKQEDVDGQNSSTEEGLQVCATNNNVEKKVQNPVESKKNESNLQSRVIILLTGDVLHNFVDGVAIGSTWSSSFEEGLATTIAVFCHELPHKLSDFAILMSTGFSLKKSFFYVFLASMSAFLGLIPGIFLSSNMDYRVWINAITAGMFLYMALVHLLPELKHMATHNFSYSLMAQTVGFTLGIGVMIAIVYMEITF